MAETSPVFFDMNGDGTPDWLLASHQPGIVVGTSTSKPASVADRKMAPYCRTYIDFEPRDHHGQNVIDIDRDGYLDTLIVGGGGLGGARGPGKSNQLFWGSEKDVIPGEANVKAGSGSRLAREAGLANSHARGRHSLLFDFNRDGLVDILFTADRPKIDQLRPGRLLLAKSPRRWDTEPAISEYSKAAMISDVDGDGLAQELLITRDYCYPYTKPPYEESTLAFCNTRPVGTTAIYRFDAGSGSIKQLGKAYKGAKAAKKFQPPCCKPGQGGVFETDNRDCYVRSLASADLDGDLLADQILLSCSILRFYFSSDRPRGTPPFGGQYIGAEVHLPETCSASALRVLDIDNDGEVDILVSCFQPGKLLLVERGDSLRSWHATQDCQSLSGLSDLGPALPDRDDFSAACEASARAGGNPEPIVSALCGKNPDYLLLNQKLNKKQRKAGYMNFRFAGLSVVDLDSDGFLDLVYANHFGKLQFFANHLTDERSSNRFISFRLLDAETGQPSPLSVGTTLILKARDCDNCNTQFREISSFQSAPDKYGYIDDRIVFGLGPSGVPEMLLVRRPDGTEHQVGLKTWRFKGRNEPVDIAI